jgi:arylsulfatase A-like enzyme
MPLRSLLAVCLTLGAVLPVFGASAGATRPNVIVILADDLGYSDVGCYGSEIKTPHLDELAGGGVRFTQFYNTARCWPTRASVLSGYYAQQVRRDLVAGVPSGNRGTRPSWAKLLPELLRAAGYRSYHSGKWHVDGRPLETGFDRSFEIGGGQNSFFKAAGITAEGKPVPLTEDFYVTTATAEHAIASLREHAATFRDQPFFQFLAFTAPHFPLHAPAADIARVGKRYQVGWDIVRRERYARLKALGFASTALPEIERDLGPPYAFPEAIAKLGPNEVNRPVPWETLTEAQRKFQADKMAVHAAMIEVMDREIGRVMAQLRAMEAWENTLVLFLSDNGASAEMMVRGDGHDPAAALGSARTYLSLGPGWSSVANTPFRRHKTWVHEGGIATPLIAHWPRGIAARGELRPDVGHVIDLVPTVLELAGLPPTAANGAPALPGRSLVPAFARAGAVTRDFLYFDHEGNRALRVGDWKLVSAKQDGGAWELYDLATDRGEARNLAAAQPERVAEMARRWQQAADEFAATARRDVATR